ncbi:diguanylate cyclase/phosphodiesterase with PAS/PAC sensor [Halorhodospira halochloris]|uniref:histidine kinase n=2 Tax=Halorhodospira halochloris TaxID=1052 RepID=A0A0X8X9J8_HALHR|nr:PAS domain-containing protein [Halorhodospira halochloris]BAU57950.2 diguanylate cyclase/phosphodiesterase with PAS/PAC sensor [Halorhodospira halochloris]
MENKKGSKCGCLSAKCKLDLLQQVSGIGFWEYDLCTGQVNADAQCQSLYGYDNSESERSLATDYALWREHVHPEDLSWVEEEVQAAIANGQPWRFTYRIYRSDGQLCWLHSSGHLERDDQGEPCLLIGFEQDVTAQKLQEQALEQAHERLQRAEEIVSLGHWISYPATGELIWSPMTYQLCGFPAEAEPPGWEEFIARIPEQDRHQVAEYQLQSKADTDQSQGEYRIVHPNGRVVWVREIANRWQDENGRWIIQGTIQDITEQREALERSEARRQRLEAILETIPDVALTETDLEGTIREASRSAERIFGYSREELLGSDICMLHDPAEHARVREGIARLQRTAQGYSVECELIRGTGERFQAQLSVAPLLNERGEVVGKIGACIDLSAQFADEQRLRMAQEAAGFGVWDWDLAADQVYWDEACWRMLGYDPEQQSILTFADWQKFVHPEDLERVQPIVESHLAAGSPFTIELRYRCADGSWLWVQGRGQTLRRGADGSPTYMVGTHVDVQTLKETEFALRRSELELTEAKRIARLGHWLYDIKSGDVHWSSEIYEIIGLEPAETAMDWDTFLSRVPPEDHPELYEAIERTLNRGDPYELEHHLMSVDGGRRIVQARGYAEFDAAGNPQLLRGTAQDVTEQRVLQRELAEREAHYRDLVENQPLMIERFLPDTTVTYANPALGDCLGVEPEALIGQRWLDYLPAEERENIEAHLAGFTPSHPVSQFENSMPGKNGMQLWTMWTNRAFFDEKGELSHFQSVGVDITARRRAEQAEQQLREQLETRQKELEAIFAAARSVSLIKTDLNSVIEEASTGAEVLFGYSRGELIGQHVSLLHTAEDIERLPDYVERLFKDHEPIRMETDLVYRDGSRFPALFTVHPITDGRGAMVATLGVSLDMSAQKRVEQELADTIRAKDTFLSAVSHDLRTPLNALMGFLELLDDPQISPEQRSEYMEQCRQGAQRLLGLIETLLDLARLEAGRLELRPRATELPALIDNQVAMLRSRACEKGLSLDYSIAEAVPRWVEVDDTRLGQLLSNLLSNAVKYTQQGGVELEVRTVDNTRVSFAVHDTGPGLTEQQQKEIFTAFDRGGYRGTSQGYGLGLAIVSELINLLDGELSLSSTPGQGSTFAFTIPLPRASEPSPEGESSIAAGESDAEPTASSARRPLNVLVADDEPANVMLAQALLLKLGCEVVCAQSGTEALAAWQAGDFDMLLLDLKMPDLDGDQVARSVRAEEHEQGRQPTRIVLCTAYAYSEVESLINESGCDAYLGKPLDRSALSSLLDWVASSYAK